MCIIQWQVGIFLLFLMFLIYVYITIVFFRLSGLLTLQTDPFYVN